MKNGRLFLWHLKNDKKEPWSHHKKIMIVHLPCLQSLEDLNCWANSLRNTSNDSKRPLPELAVSSDSSNIGWGTACKNEKTGGNWSIQESKQHPNNIELIYLILIIPFPLQKDMKNMLCFHLNTLFSFEVKLYKFLCLLHGLTSAPEYLQKF